MRFTDTLIFLGLLGCLAFSVATGLKNFNRLDSKSKEMKDKVNSVRFISESFRRTCCSSGFDNLEEWQKVCKRMWNLDYIAWGKAEVFMEVTDSEAGELFYGTWVGPAGKGEVYCRKS